ncbi:MAG TPA: hypothetical protein PLK24_06965 [Atribacter sp.]|uniref:hypothetical protein n=1 Tax=Atribacter sp. TaxID=2847780 RepID=UPI002B9D98F5|nr:hypothetical protein [Atribacter sp.]HQK83670.1 hypothetical protein [Atribacter sp.]
MKKLRFCTNKQLDEIMIEQFLHEQGAGVDFGKRIIKLHPKLKSAKSLENTEQKKKIIHLYVYNYYRSHKEAISQSIKNLQKAWHKKEKEFVAVTGQFFMDYQFPKGKYIAYASIVDCNPRFLDSKTFQFFYKKKLADAIHTIVHELLHFIFFDFVEKKLKSEIKILTEEQLWDLSEIFNVVVLGSAQYQNIVDKKYVFPYPHHKPLLSQFRKAYKDSCNAEEFIKRGVTIIKTKK